MDKALDISHLRREAERLSTSPALDTHETLSYIAWLNEEMDMEIQRLDQHDPDTVQILDAISRCIMLPIRLPNSAHMVDKLVAAADNDEEWYIADREIFFTSFKFQAPLLALDSKQTERCRTLLRLLRLDDRRLSRNAVAVSATETEMEETAARKWDAWAQYIDR